MKKQNTRKGMKIFLLNLFIAITFFTVSEIPCSAQNQAGAAGYATLIQQADQALAAKDYPAALMLYSKASYAKPELSYAPGKISEINETLDANPDLRAQLFENTILKAENLFKLKDYAQSKQEYQKALALDPSAQFPKDRLAQISALYTDPADISYYNDAVSNGDKALAANDFDKAVLFYETALAVKPDAKVVKDKISATKKQQSDFRTKSDQAEKIISAADKLLLAGKRTEARTEYQKVLDLTPGNAHARQKIQEIDNYTNETKAVQDSYDKAIEQADQFYINRDFINARLKYQDALKAKPEARYPKEMLEKTKSGESQLQSDQQKYDAALASAEALYNNGDLENALTGYKSALAIKPAEAYPKTKIAETEKLISERTSRKEAYDIAIKNGDQALDAKKYDPALAHYRNALTLMPGEKYPTGKIEEITALLAQQKTLEDMYQKLVADADKLFTQSKFAEAISSYNKALELKPDEVYLQQKITESQNQLATLKYKEESYAATISEGDKLLANLKYDEALNSYKKALSIKPAEKYPKEKSDEISKILAKQKSDADKYTASVANGDKALAAGNFTLALTSFREASAAKPDEQYPKDKINEINTAIAEKQKTDDQYNAAIKNADQRFTAKEYEQALASYMEASDLKKNEKYPQDQISKINKFISDARSADENYMQAITEGDNYFNSQKLPEAITAYKKAQAIKPAEAYPKSQIDKINTLVAEQKKLDADYLASITAADKLFAAKNYSDAMAGYRQALSIKPAEKYPSDKIAETEKLLADQKLLQESYEKAIADGEKSLSEKDYSNALTSFKNAGSLKPSESYPKQKITQIQAILDKDKAESQRYSEAIALGDKFFTDNNLTQALEPYQQASALRPSENYPKDQLTRINQLIAEQKKLDTDYLALITNADTKLKAASYEEAKSLYTSAGTLKPAEKLPKDKIAEIDAILADLQNKEQNYSKYIADADASFASEKYTEAITSYNSALKIKPAEAYPKAQVDKINTILAEQKKRDTEYLEAVASADKLFAAKTYTDAIAGYRKALELKPSEKYPQDKIAEAEKLIADIRTTQESYDKAIAEGEKFLTAKDYENSITLFKTAGTLKPSEAYPKQKIAEIQDIINKNKAEQQSYSEAVAQADKLFTDQKLKEALESYQRASVIKPNEKYPLEQAAKITGLLAEQKKLEDDYIKLISDADAEFKSSHLNEARNLYSNAGLLKPAEKLPKEKIAEIDRIQADLLSKEQNYTKAISEGDASFADKKYAEAITSYNAASALKPSESYPKEQVLKINAIIAEQKKLDDNYLSLLVVADKSFDGKKYPEAIADYRKAQEIKPNETYPAEQIARAEKQIADLKAQQEAYDKAIADGDTKLAARDYENALADYKNAIQLKPLETYPKQKSAEIQLILDKNKADNTRYQEAIALADKFFAAGKYRDAMEPYQTAVTVKPGEKYPQDQIAQINKLLAEQKKQDDDYQNMITQAGTQFAAKKYDDARSLFTKASALKPSEKQPKEKIAEIDGILENLRIKDENYSKALSDAAQLYAAKNLPGAIKSYEDALAIKPSEKLSQEKIAAIKAELKAVDDSYSNAVALGDTKLASKNLMEALNAYQNALEIKPAEEYPKTKIAEINTLVAAQKEEQEKLYVSYIADGDRLFTVKDYQGSKSAFTKASGIKPSETYPKQRITEIDKIAEEAALARRAEYNKAIGEADKLYNTKIFDQAIEAYEAASLINPLDQYPQQQIAKIRKYMADHAIQDLFSQSLLISEGNEKKFTFPAIELRQRKNNYILLKARSTGKTAPKVFLNYGKDNQKNGGIVLRSLDKSGISDYLIRISVQDKWYREDNNWISLFVETGEIEITKVQIAAGDD